MENNFTIPFILIVLHFINDFIFQDEEWAVNKSRSITALLNHTKTYSLLWTIPIFFIIKYFGDDFNILQIVVKTIDFVLITFIMHTLTDYFTSKVTSYLYSRGKYGSSIPNLGFFTMIGFDQVLHYAQLFMTIYILL